MLIVINEAVPGFKIVVSVFVLMVILPQYCEADRFVQRGPLDVCKHVYWNDHECDAESYTGEPCTDYTLLSRLTWNFIIHMCYKYTKYTRYRNQDYKIEASRLISGTHALYMDIYNEDDKWKHVQANSRYRYNLRIDGEVSNHRWIDGTAKLTTAENPRKAWLMTITKDAHSNDELNLKGYGWGSQTLERPQTSYDRLTSNELRLTIYQDPNWHQRYMFIDKLYWFELYEGGDAKIIALKEIKHFDNCTVNEVIENHLMTEGSTLCSTLRACSSVYNKMSKHDMEDTLSKCCTVMLKEPIRQFNAIIDSFGNTFHKYYANKYTTSASTTLTKHHF